MLNSYFNYDWLIKHLITDNIISIAPETPNTLIKNPIQNLASQKIVTTKGILDEQAIALWLANYNKSEFVYLDLLSLPERCSIFPSNFIKIHKIIPLKFSNKCYTIAHSSPDTEFWVHLLEHFYDITIKTVFAEPSKIEQIIDQVYTLDDFIEHAHEEQSLFNKTLDVSNTESNNEQQYISEISNRILQQAAKSNASDIHIEPVDAENTRIRLRIDGILHNTYSLPSTVASALANRIKILAGMDIAERRKSQDGRFQFKQNTINFDARVATIPVLQGEKIVIRLLNSQSIQCDFTELGMPNKTLNQWQNLITSSSGLILLAGPTGCGKSTSLYSSLIKLNSTQISIATIEDPIEYVVKSFNQTQVQPHIGLDYATGLRALLRQDPDVIMIGEIRDEETAKIAIQAALTGHLVFASIHAASCDKAQQRLLELGVPQSLIAQTILAIMSQRLVRKLCPKCQDIKNGCHYCHNTGYYGRVGLFQLSRQLEEGFSSNESFTQLGDPLIQNNLTTQQEITRVCKNM